MANTWRKGDRVRVTEAAVPSWRPDYIGLDGTVVNVPDPHCDNPVLRVRIDGGTATAYTEVDATAEKFERLTAGNT